MDNVEFYPLHEEHIEDATRIYAEAFSDDPLFNYFLPKEEGRLKTLYTFFRPVVTFNVQFGEVYGIGDPIQGVATWETPLVKRRVKIGGLLRCGFHRIMFTPFFWSFFRATRVGWKTRKLHKKYASDDHFYLEILAVDPNSQGKGYASKLVKPMIRKAQERELPVYLETSSAKNVPMYEHFGFKMVEDYEFGDGELKMWSLFIHK